MATKKLEYTGKGFIGFDDSDRTMIFVKKDGQFDTLVTYKGHEMLVRNTEIK